jgi:hypothetical protein
MADGLTKPLNSAKKQKQATASATRPAGVGFDHSFAVGGTFALPARLFWFDSSIKTP